VGNRYVWQGGQTENQGGQTKNFFGASRRILPTLAWNPAGAPARLNSTIPYTIPVQERTPD